jgi:glycosyltransferase involved in cell wall biosynthesis
MKQPIRIAFVSLGDPRDRRSSSGGLFSMYQALERNGAVLEQIGPVPDRLEDLTGRLLGKLIARATGKRYDRYHVPFWARQHARYFSSRLRGGDYDVIFSPFTSSGLADIETGIPIIYFSDATYNKLIGYNSIYSNLATFSIRAGNDLERRALARAARVIYPSPWAAESAVCDYGVPREKIHVYPLGANLDTPPSREEALSRKRGEVCRLLFLAKEWTRKGGDVAIAALEELGRRGVRATLMICGVRPPSNFSHPSLTIVPYLDKNKPEQREQLRRILLDSDFMILPTRRECFGYVFCEAAANGLYVFTSNTGGIPGAVSQGENGTLLSPDADGAAYAQAIEDHFKDEERYYSGVRAARDAFEERLNWDAWGRRTIEIAAEAAGSMKR